jgi:ribosomal protein S12 methylthiotransferase accessory factor
VFEADSIVDIPTYGGALVNTNEEYPKFILAGAAAMDPLEAIEEVLVEIGQGWVNIHERKGTHETDALKLDDEIWNFEDNVALYAKPTHFDKVQFFLEGVAGCIEQDPITGRTLDSLLAKLDDAGTTPIAVDVTTTDVASVGIRVVKVLIPELLSLVPPSCVPKDHPRLSSIDPPDLPHPFP